MLGLLEFMAEWSALERVLFFFALGFLCAYIGGSF